MAGIAISWAHVLATITVVVRASSKIDCNDGKFYIRADPKSCSHFYKCDNGNPVRFNCSPGLYYNPAIYVCDWPYNVKCSVKNSNQGQNANKQNTNSYDNQWNNQEQKTNNQNTNSYDYQWNNQEQNTNNHNTNSYDYQWKQNSVYDGQENQNYNIDDPSNNGYENGQNLIPHYVVIDPNEGPTVQEPLGPLDRPRPTIDDDKSTNNNPYNQYVENDIDIR